MGLNLITQGRGQGKLSLEALTKDMGYQEEGNRKAKLK
jgi:hypothetical protein